VPRFEFVAPADGLPATPLIVGAVSKAPHPEAAKLFVRLGDVEAWPGLVSNQPESLLRVGAHRCAANCDRGAAG